VNRYILGLSVALLVVANACVGQGADPHSNYNVGLKVGELIQIMNGEVRVRDSRVLPQSLEEIELLSASITPTVKADFIDMQYNTMKEMDMYISMFESENVWFETIGYHVAQSAVLNYTHTSWYDVVNLNLTAHIDDNEQDIVLKTIWFRNSENFVLASIGIDRD